MKKLYVILFSLVLILTTAACSQSPTVGTVSNSGTSNSSSNSTGPIEIQYWYAFGDKIGENNENLAKKFNESQNEVIVHAHYQGNYEDLHAKTQAALAAGNAPEVTLNEIASVGVFATSGMTEELTPFIERDNVDMDDFVQGLMGN